MSGGRIRVLQVITSLAGGAGLHAYQLAGHLDPARFDVHLAYGSGYPLDACVEEEGLSHTILGWRRSPNPVASARGLADVSRLVRATRPQIMHMHCSIAGIMGRWVAAREGVPHIIFSVHALTSRDHQPSWRKRLFLQIERGMDRYTDRYCVFTQNLKDQLVQRRIARPEKIQVVPHGIEIGDPPSPEVRRRARESLGLSEGDLAVATAGRLEPQKGLTYLVRAFQGVQARVPEARLLVFGDGPLRGSLEAEVRARGLGERVRFLGWRDNMRALLAGVDLFCLASLWETFGYVLLEAMSAEVPIVATDVDGIPEVVGDSTVGLLVPPADPDALGAAIGSLLAEPVRRRNMGQAGRKRAETLFRLARMIERYETLYTDLHVGEPSLGGRR